MTDPNSPQIPSDGDFESEDLPSLQPEEFPLSPPERLFRKPRLPGAATEEKEIPQEPLEEADAPMTESAPSPQPAAGSSRIPGPRTPAAAVPPAPSSPTGPLVSDEADPVKEPVQEDTVEPEPAPAPNPEPFPAVEKRGSLKTPPAEPLPSPNQVPPIEAGDQDPTTIPAPADEEFSSAAARPNTHRKDEEMPKLQPTERLWVGLLVAGILVIGGLAFWLIRGGLPPSDAARPVSSPRMPVQGQKVTISKMIAGWKRSTPGKTSGGARGPIMVPMVEMAVAPTSQGALRLFFKDERGQSVGDTVNITVSQGKFSTGTDTNLIFCTAGLRTELEYSDLRARQDRFWTVEIMEGPDTMAKKSEFRLLLNLQIPWDLDGSPAPD